MSSGELKSFSMQLPSYREFQWQSKNGQVKILCNKDLQEVIFLKDELVSEFQDFLNTVLGTSFDYVQRQIDIHCTPLFFSLIKNENLVIVNSPRLNSELFLIDNIEQSHDEKLCQLKESNEYLEFKSITEKVVSIPSQELPSEIQFLTQIENLPNLLEKPVVSNDDVEAKVKKLLVHLNEYRPTLFEKISDFGLDLTAKYALLRIHLLKFLAILPSLDHDVRGHEVKRILLESLRRLRIDSKKAKVLNKKGQNRPLTKRLIFLMKLKVIVFNIMPAGMLATIVRSSVKFMAKRFIAGETIESSDTSLKDLFSTGRDVTLDQLGELVVSEKEADHYCSEVIKLIEGFSLHVPVGQKNNAGILRAHVSIKVSALCSDFKPHAPEYTFKLVSDRLRKILICAKNNKVFINIDAEHYDYRDIVFKVYRKVLIETPELHDFADTGIVLQAYLRDAYKHLLEIIELSKERNLIMPIRIVKGAYWDAETVEADAHSFNAPEFLNKEETDIHFRQLIVKIFDNYPHVQLCLASHNFSDHCFARVLKDEHYKNLPEIEHQCLHMTYEALSTAMSKSGWVVRNYVPIGSLLVGMAYLVRRIMENSSQVGVLTMMRSHKKKMKILPPENVHLDNLKNNTIKRDLTLDSLTSEFFNITPVRAYLDEQRKWISNSLIQFKEKNLDKHYTNSFLAKGEEQLIASSSDPNINVGRIYFGSEQDAKIAMDVLESSYVKGDWPKSNWLVRSNIFCRAANLMLARRKELSSLIVYEAGKSILEAYGDVDEAIDFLNFYAREERKISVHGKFQQSKGPVVVISPWNFPLAIPCGMTVAALVAGNTVCLKSAEQTPLIAQVLVDLLHEAGVPKDVLIHLPGMGETVGAGLVNSDFTSMVVFTGSKNVGQLISNQVQKKLYSNKLLDRKIPVKAITEMGGKNAIIVTANAELDETVSGILASAFGHAGQKCSAASRVIVDNAVKDRLIERLREACLDIEVSEAFNFSCSINPVITAEDKERLVSQARQASEEAIAFGGQVIVDRTNDILPGYCVGPAIFELPFKRALDKESFSQRELFGPVVHIIGFNYIDEAIHLYNSTQYALTGGIFSQSQDDIDYVVSKIESGNIYINRNITGARVGIEPFGGFKLSGTGPKAGGRGYLPIFHVNNNEIKTNNESFDEGSDYQIDLARPNKVSNRHRLLKIEKALDLLVKNFDSLYGGLFPYEKGVVKKFTKWMSKNALYFIEKEHGNVKIPGQLSYNDFNLVQDNTVVISSLDRPHLSTLLNVMAAISMGTGVSILCRSTKSYDFWTVFVSYFSQSGIGKDNLDVYFASEKEVDRVYSLSSVCSFILDLSPSSLEKNLAKVFIPNDESVLMRHAHSYLDSPNDTDFKRYCSNFVLVRAFAVNTMRHGAPLEIDL